MKKHNEGYSLVLVLVVLTLMSLVASFILSVSLKNLKSQTAAVTRMQDEYTAAGEIEKVVGKLKAFEDGSLESGELCTETEMKEKVMALISSVNACVTMESFEISGGDLLIDLKTDMENQSVNIACRLRITAPVFEQKEGQCTLVAMKELTFASYEVFTVAETEEGGGGE